MRNSDQSSRTVPEERLVDGSQERASLSNLAGWKLIFEQVLCNYRKLDDFLREKDHDVYDGLYIAGALLASQQLDSLLVCHTFGTLFNIGIKVKSGLSSAIYQKVWGL